VKTEVEHTIFAIAAMLV